jgi:hypothetical protein
MLANSGLGLFIVELHSLFHYYYSLPNFPRSESTSSSSGFVELVVCLTITADYAVGLIAGGIVIEGGFIGR